MHICVSMYKCAYVCGVVCCVCVWLKITGALCAFEKSFIDYIYRHLHRYLFIYIYTHTNTHTHTLGLWIGMTKQYHFYNCRIGLENVVQEPMGFRIQKKRGSS